MQVRTNTVYTNLVVNLSLQTYIEAEYYKKEKYLILDEGKHRWYSKVIIFQKHEQNNI